MRTRKRALAAAVVVAALAVWGTVKVYPYVLYPKLLNDPWAVNTALADAVVQTVGLTAVSIDTVRDGPLIGGETYDRYNPPLCTVDELTQTGFPPRHCEVITPFPDDPDCRNVAGCAHLQVHPSVLRDPSIVHAIRGALAEPCRVFDESAELPGRRGSMQLRGFHNTASGNRSLLRCDRSQQVRGRAIEFDPSGAIRLKF